MTQQPGAAKLDFLMVSACRSPAPAALAKLGLSPVSIFSVRKFLLVSFMGENFVRKRCNNISKTTIDGSNTYIHTLHTRMYIYIFVVIKSVQITFTTKAAECPPVMLNDEPIPLKKEVKYLGLHLDRRLTWKAHIKAKKQQLNIKTKQMNWLIGRKSQLSLDNKIIIYKVILKPIWTYGIELWGCAKPSNTKILQTPHGMSPTKPYIITYKYHSSRM
jgi:hypothetical protein